MNFVSINFEIAGYSPKNACSLGMVKYQDSKKVDSFYSLIQPPEIYTRPNFTAIHNLTVEDIKNVPTFAELWESKILPFIDGLPLAAHNANFDMGVLLSALEFYKLYSPALRYFCSLELARSMWPSMKSYTLTAIAKEFDIEYKVHNALDNAETCGKIVLMAADEFHSADLKNLLSIVEMDIKTVNKRTLSDREVAQLLSAINGTTDANTDDIEYCSPCPLTENAVPLSTIDIVSNSSDSSDFAIDCGSFHCFSMEDLVCDDNSDHADYSQKKARAVNKLDKLRSMDWEYRKKILKKFSLKELESLMFAMPWSLHNASEEDKDLFEAFKSERWGILNRSFIPTKENILRVVEVSNRFLKAWEDGFRKAKNLLEAIYETEQDKDCFTERYGAVIKLYPEIWYKNTETGEWEDRDDIYMIMYSYCNMDTLFKISVNYDPATKDESDFRDNLHVSRESNWKDCPPMGNFFGDHYLCYAIHELWDHQEFALQDIAMINNINVCVEIQYFDRERMF